MEITKEMEEEIRQTISLRFYGTDYDELDEHEIEQVDDVFYLIEEILEKYVKD